jgi:single-strand DNA-binding protein
MVWYGNLTKKGEVMSDVNHVVFSGRLTRNPELRKTPSGVSVTDIAVASNRFARDKRQFTTYLRCTLWDKQAEWACENLGTGDTVFLQGQLVDDNFEKDGNQTSGRLKLDNARVQLMRKRATQEESESANSEETPEV